MYILQHTATHCNTLYMASGELSSCELDFFFFSFSCFLLFLMRFIVKKCSHQKKMEESVCSKEKIMCSHTYVNSYMCILQHTATHCSALYMEESICSREIRVLGNWYK